MHDSWGSVGDRTGVPQEHVFDLIPPEIVKDTRGYVENMVVQANGCYKNGWFDACAVMVRRLLEMLIIDNFSAENRLDDIRDVPNLSFVVATAPSALDIREFLRSDWPKLEEALNLVRIARGDSPSVDYFATSNWQSIMATEGAAPDDVRKAFDLVLDVREKALRGINDVTRDDLVSAKKAVLRILDFLAKEYRRAGIQVPGSGYIMPLGRLIEAYVAAPTSYWHVERNARSALPKLKRIGDIGAHGLYEKVTKQRLDRHQELLECAIGQLVGTAYRR